MYMHEGDDKAKMTWNEKIKLKLCNMKRGWNLSRICHALGIESMKV
jgi:hypothetical protein